MHVQACQAVAAHAWTVNVWTTLLAAVDSTRPISAAGNTPQETYEKHAHNVHDHDENETYERRNVG